MFVLGGVDGVNKKTILWPRGTCPMLFPGNAGTDAATYYRMDEKEVDSWCRGGCCPDCGEYLQQHIERKRRKEQRCQKNN